MVGTRFDPATNYGGAVALARELDNARLLTLDGWGHVALPRSVCIAAAEARYLVDLTLPAAGTVCQPDTKPFEAPLAAGSVAPGMGSWNAWPLCAVGCPGKVSSISRG